MHCPKPLKIKTKIIKFDKTNERKENDNYLYITKNSQESNRENKISTEKPWYQ